MILHESDFSYDDFLDPLATQFEVDPVSKRTVACRLRNGDRKNIFRCFRPNRSRARSLIEVFDEILQAQIRILSHKKVGGSTIISVAQTEIESNRS